MADSLDFLRRSGRWLRLTCWRCGHAKQFYPSDLEKALGRKGWDETVYSFASRSVCACGARSPKREMEWKPSDRPLWAKLAFPSPGDDQEEMSRQLGEHMEAKRNKK